MDDLISRKALIEKHCAENCGCTRGECGLTYEEDGCDACTFVKEVEQAPAVEAEPVRHGEWELIADCANEGVYCSNCHKKVYKADYANQKLKSKRCPNCGAKMRCMECVPGVPCAKGKESV